MNDYQSPCHMIWDLAGRPDPTDPASGDGICAMCGQHGPLHAKLGSSFTDYRQLAHIDGTRLCAACSWTYGGKPPKTLRLWSVVARLDQPAPRADFGTMPDPAWTLIEDPAAHGQVDESRWVRINDLTELAESRNVPAASLTLNDIVGNVETRLRDDPPPEIPRRPYAEGEFLHATNRKDMRWVASTLAAPPADGSPWLVAVAESGQKHCAPFTAVNHGTGQWTVALDGYPITSTTGQWYTLLAHSAALRKAGFGAAAIETGQPPLIALKDGGLEAWRRHHPHLAAFVDTPLLHLTNLMITKETVDDYITNYPTN